MEGKCQGCQSFQHFCSALPSPIEFSRFKGCVSKVPSSVGESERTRLPATFDFIVSGATGWSEIRSSSGRDFPDSVLPPMLPKLIFEDVLLHARKERTQVRPQSDRRASKQRDT